MVAWGGEEERSRREKGRERRRLLSEKAEDIVITFSGGEGVDFCALENKTHSQTKRRKNGFFPRGR